MSFAGDSPGGGVDWDRLAARCELVVELLSNGVMRLSEKIVAREERSFFYLVEGAERDCLVDGGWGFTRSLDTVRREPDKPLIAVATHSHFDHIGALHLARRRFGHAAEAAIFAAPDAAATQALPYLAGRPVLADGGMIDPASIHQRPCPLDRLVADGDEIDLGGRVLAILHTPGHSPGSLSLLDRNTGFLFPADTVHDGHIYDDIPGAKPEELLMSHRRLAEVDFALACPGHGAILSPAMFRARMERYRRETGTRFRSRKRE